MLSGSTQSKSSQLRRPSLCFHNCVLAVMVISCDHTHWGISICFHLHGNMNVEFSMKMNNQKVWDGVIVQCFILWHVSFILITQWLSAVYLRFGGHIFMCLILTMLMKDFTILLSDNYLKQKSVFFNFKIVLYYINLWCFIEIFILGFLILLRNMWIFCILFLGQDIFCISFYNMNMTL